MIESYFQIKGPRKNEPAQYADGHFEGFEIGPHNPNVSIEESPLYLFTWQQAGLMTENEENGCVYVYDIKAATSFDKQKFMIKCHGG